MKRNIFYIMVVFLFISCGNGQKYNCNEVFKEISKTDKIMVGEILPAYSSYSREDGKVYNFGKGTERLALIYFYKSKPIEDGAISFQNKNIPDKKLWRELEKRNAQIDMNNDVKMASLFGFFNDKTRQIDTGYLIVTNDGIIRNIYSDVCPDSIMSILMRNF